MCIWIIIGMFGKIMVERSDNWVFVDRIIGMVFLLFDVWIVSICYNSSFNFLESINYFVMFGGSLNLFRIWIDN